MGNRRGQAFISTQCKVETQKSESGERIETELTDEGGELARFGVQKGEEHPVEHGSALSTATGAGVVLVEEGVASMVTAILDAPVGAPEGLGVLLTA